MPVETTGPGDWTGKSCATRTRRRSWPVGAGFRWGIWRVRCRPGGGSAGVRRPGQRGGWTRWRAKSVDDVDQGAALSTGRRASWTRWPRGYGLRSRASGRVYRSGGVPWPAMVRSPCLDHVPLRARLRLWRRHNARTAASAALSHIALSSPRSTRALPGSALGRASAHRMRCHRATHSTTVNSSAPSPKAGATRPTRPGGTHCRSTARRPPSTLATWPPNPPPSTSPPRPHATSQFRGQVNEQVPTERAGPALTGKVEKPANRVYRAGPVLELAAHSQSRVSRLRAATLPHLRRLVDFLDETVNLTIRTGDTTRFIASAESGQSLRVDSREGVVFPAHRTIAGLRLLAELHDDELAEVYSASRLPLPPRRSSGPRAAPLRAGPRRTQRLRRQPGAVRARARRRRRTGVRPGRGGGSGPDGLDAQRPLRPARSPAPDCDPFRRGSLAGGRHGRRALTRRGRRG